MSLFTEANTVEYRLRNLLRIDVAANGPAWQPIEPTTSFFREAVLRNRLEGAPCDPDEMVSTLRAAWNILLEHGLPPATLVAHRWIQREHLSWFVPDDATCEVAFGAVARAPTRTVALDAVLFVDGVALAIIERAPCVGEARSELEDLAEMCPAWFVTPMLLVALGDDGAEVTVPGAFRGWRACDETVLGQLLSPMQLLRFALYDVSVERTGGPEVRRFPAPVAVLAAEAAFERALAQDNGLLSITEGADHLLFVRSLVARLLRDGLSVCVVAWLGEHLQRLRLVLHELMTDGADSLDARLVVGSLTWLAGLYETGEQVEEGGRVVIAFGVDAGFRGEQGFYARLLLRGTPWISLTTLPPFAVAPEVLHAYGNPLDDGGFLDVVEGEEGRVPVWQQVVRLSFGWEPFHIEQTVDLLRSELPNTTQALVLVESIVEATFLTERLEEAGIRVHNATAWMRANEGWRLLEAAREPTVVIRTSLPFWANIPHLDAAFVFRRVGRTTLARLRNLLARPWPGKQHGRFIVAADLGRLEALGLDHTPAIEVNR